MTAEAVTYSVNPRQRRGLLTSAPCVAEHRRWRSGHHRHHIKQTGDSRRYALRRCATSPRKHPIKTFFVRENPQWIPRITRLCRFLVRTVTLNGKVKIKNSQIQRVFRTKSAQFAKHLSQGLTICQPRFLLLTHCFTATKTTLPTIAKTRICHHASTPWRFDQNRMQSSPNFFYYML